MCLQHGTECPVQQLYASGWGVILADDLQLSVWEELLARIVLPIYVSPLRNIKGIHEHTCSQGGLL